MTITPHQSGTVGVAYFQWKHLLTQGLISTLVVVYYTTDQSLLRIIYSSAHLITFAFTFVLMLLLAVCCGLISRLLDNYIPWYKDISFRLFWQVILGVIFLSAASLYSVYGSFYLLLGVNLWETDYFSRDFTIVMASIICINFHHYILYLRTFIKSTRTGEGKKILPLPRKALEDELHSSFAVLETEKEILVARIGSFYLQEIGQKPKIVRLVQWDGTEFTMKESISLSGIMEQCPLVFIKVSRDRLVNRFAVKNFQISPERKYEIALDIDGMEPMAVSRDIYFNLQSELDFKAAFIKK